MTTMSKAEPVRYELVEGVPVLRLVDTNPDRTRLWLQPESEGLAGWTVVVGTGGVDAGGAVVVREADGTYRLARAVGGGRACPEAGVLAVVEVVAPEPPADAVALILAR